MREAVWKCWSLQEAHEVAQTTGAEICIYATIRQACTREVSAQEARHRAEASENSSSAEVTQRSAPHCSVKSSSSTASSSTANSQQMPIDQGPFVAPAELVAPDLDKKSPHFRVAHVRHFRKLKANFPMLDKKMYHEANESSLGVKLRRFQAWFQQYEEDVITMKRAKPLVKKERRHNKVEFQAARAHYTPKETANTTETTTTKKATSDSSCCPKITSWTSPKAVQTGQQQAF